MSLVAHQEGGLSLFHLFGVVSSTFQPPLAISLFRVVPFLQTTALQNVLTCKFTMKQLHGDFITKNYKRHYKVGQLKVVQVLQIGHVLQRGTTFI